MSYALLAVLISILLLIVLVSLPLIPAVVIYRLFPNTTVAANGPLSGLTLKSSGAFSVYVVVFLVMAPFAYKTYGQLAILTHPSWTVSGNIVLQGADGREIDDLQTIKSVSVSLDPQLIQLDGENFQVKVLQNDDGVPRLTFNVGDIGSSTVDVDNPGALKVSRDAQTMTIRILTPVTVRLGRTGGNYNAAAAPLLASGPAP